MNRFVILDQNGIMLNRIKSRNEILPCADYGLYIVYEGEGDIPKISVEEPWIYLSVKPDMSMAQGDVMDIKTGIVTRNIPENTEVYEVSE